MKFTFSLRAFLLFLFFLLIEIVIGIYVKDSFIRPYGGDFLVVFLVFYAFKTFLPIKAFPLILVTLFLAYLVEFTQYLRLADVLNIKNKVVRIILGTSFSWEDMIAYTLGCICCYFIEIKIFNQK